MVDGDTCHARRFIRKPQLWLYILRAGRQVYQEAALIPYAENAFSFATGSYRTVDWSFDHFIASLTPAQKKAIKSLILSKKCRDSVFDFFSATPASVKALKGLSSLQVFFECPNHALKQSFVNHDSTFCGLSGSLVRFETLPLTSVNIRIIPDNAKVLPEVRDMCKNLERRLLQAWDENAYQRDVLEQRAFHKAGKLAAKEGESKESIARRKKRGLREMDREIYG